MTLPRKLSIATAGAAAILSTLSVPVSAFTINQPIEPGYDLYDPLGGLPAGATGQVILNPRFFVGYRTPPTAGGTLFTRFIAEALALFPGWTAVSGAALGGRLVINEYDARDYAAEPDLNFTGPRGGADMRATYIRAFTDPAIANLRYIQVFTDNAGPNGAVRSHIDRLHRTNVPSYYSDAQHTARSTEATMNFIDSPSDLVKTIPFNRTVSFETYLSTFDNTNKVATIHDGWSWGYEVQAVPEPVTIIGSAMGLGLGAFFKRQVSRKSKKN